MIEVVVTSHKRLKYLKLCLKSLRQDDIRLIVVDDSQDFEINAYIQSICDVWVYCPNSISADEAKNEGIKRVQGEEFILTADDIVFPQGYSNKLVAQLHQLNKDGLKYSFMACNTSRVNSLVNSWAVPWYKTNEIEMVDTGASQVLGAILHKSLWKAVDGFPCYGMSGQGDIAFSHRLRKIGIQCGYFKTPFVTHLGEDKTKDFPEYSESFQKDEDKYRLEAMTDTWESKI